MLQQLIEGTIGIVIDDHDEDQEYIEYDGKRFYISEPINVDLYQFIKDNLNQQQDNLFLFREDGYRGMLCYWGLMYVDHTWYVLDIVSEGQVYSAYIE